MESRFQVGDLVRVREWDDMEEQYGRREWDGAIKTRYPFFNGLRRFCGKEFRITCIDNDGGIYGLGTPVSDDALELIRSEDNSVEEEDADATGLEELLRGEML